jgi:endonuclease/exonuclease/phosphatase family metal-dependent hydrolase
MIGLDNQEIIVGTVNILSTNLVPDNIDLNKRIFQIINNIWQMLKNCCHVVVVQEVDRPSLENLQDAFPHVIHASFEKGHTVAAVSNTPFTNVKEFKINEYAIACTDPICPPKRHKYCKKSIACTRKALSFKLKDHNAAICTFHLPCMFTKWNKHVPYIMIHSIITSLYHMHRNCPIILAGDFNIDHTSGTDAAMIELIKDFPWFNAVINPTQRYTNISAETGFKGILSWIVTLIPKPYYINMINVEHLCNHEYMHYRDHLPLPNAYYPSDHLPVISHINIYTPIF